MPRHRFSTTERIIGVQTALASDKTPERLKPGLRKYLKTLQGSREGKRDLLDIIFPRKRRVAPVASNQSAPKFRRQR